MAFIPIQQPEKKASGGKLGGILGHVAGGLGAALGGVSGGPAGALQGLSAGEAIGNSAGNMIDPAKAPDGSKLNSFAGDSLSMLNGLVKAKSALKTSALPVDQYHAYDNHLNTAINELQTRYGMGNARLKGNF